MRDAGGTGTQIWPSQGRQKGPVLCRAWFSCEDHPFIIKFVRSFNSSMLSLTCQAVVRENSRTLTGARHVYFLTELAAALDTQVALICEFTAIRDPYNGLPK